MDVYKLGVYVTVMEENVDMKEQYEIVNDESAWAEFRERYIYMKPVKSRELSTSRKHVAQKLRDIGFHVHVADPSNLSHIQHRKKNNRENSYNLANLFMLGALPEVNLTFRYSDDLRSLVRSRKALGESIIMIKNMVQAILVSAA